jgi:hypothetical protein
MIGTNPLSLHLYIALDEPMVMSHKARNCRKAILNPARGGGNTFPALSDVRFWPKADRWSGSARYNPKISACGGS